MNCKNYVVVWEKSYKRSAFLIARLLARNFGYHIESFYKLIGKSKEEFWSTFMSLGCLEEVISCICEDLEKDSIFYVHVDEPQML